MLMNSGLAAAPGESCLNYKGSFALHLRLLRSPILPSLGRDAVPGGRGGDGQGRQDAGSRVKKQQMMGLGPL